MSGQNNFWSLNIKFLRNRKQLSRRQLAHKTGIPTAMLRSYEQGRVSDPALNHLLDISAYFRLGVDTLLAVNLAALPARAVQESDEERCITGNKINRILAAAGEAGRLSLSCAGFRAFIRKSVPV